jgi:hypothetical protein
MLSACGGGGQKADGGLVDAPASGPDGGGGSGGAGAGGSNAGSAGAGGSNAGGAGAGGSNAGGAGAGGSNAGGAGSGGGDARDARPDGAPGAGDLQGAWRRIEAPSDGGATTHRRLRFDGDRYFVVYDSLPGSYCAETGTFQVSSTSVTFTLDQTKGTGRCDPASARTELVGWTDSGIVFDAAGVVASYVRARDVPKVFVTVEQHDGNLAADTSLPGANAIEKADALCNRSIAKPDAGRYRAMLVDGSNRTSLPRKDWVLSPLTTYFQADGALNAFTTNTIGIANTEGNNPIVSVQGALISAWTGLGFDFQGRDTCNGWTSAGTSIYGGMAYVDTAQFTFAFGAGSNCGNAGMSFVCVSDGVRPPGGDGGIGGPDGGPAGADAGVSDLEGDWRLLNPPPGAGTVPGVIVDKRLKFEGDTYTAVWSATSTYCGETGLFQITNQGVAFHPSRVEGYGACAIGSDRVEPLTRAPSEISLTFDGRESRYAHLPDVPKLFVTFETHNGNFAGDGSLPGNGAIEKADSFCNQSLAKPDRRAYKAVLVDGTRRSGQPAADWVFKPSTGYFLANGVSIAFTTDSAGLPPNGGSTAIVPGFGSIEYMWTGIGANFATYSDTCQGWTSHDPALRGGSADVRWGVGVAVIAGCNYVSHGLICVGQ